MPTIQITSNDHVVILEDYDSTVAIVVNTVPTNEVIIPFVYNATFSTADPAPGSVFPGETVLVANSGLGGIVGAVYESQGEGFYSGDWALANFDNASGQVSWTIVVFTTNFPYPDTFQATDGPYVTILEGSGSNGVLEHTYELINPSALNDTNYTNWNEVDFLNTNIWADITVIVTT